MGLKSSVSKDVSGRTREGRCDELDLTYLGPGELNIEMLSHHLKGSASNTSS